ncbi:hypothetical protein [Streptomyces sp. NBC_00268]|uniref:hypothetical protein n=1 Tax=Streptomyces sp. NBC_00268 TaxID=2975695 RepID=UPI0022536788|nr:hypothetical protein [Streptomyces sp. NBC_00268]MCX5182584.1 hypothetical protein [Streptomyces sp. NBC_00268]
MATTLATTPRHGVTLEKDPTAIVWFLAVVTDMATPAAQVHELVVTFEDVYDSQVEAAHRRAATIDGASVQILFAGDRSEAYTVVRTGQDFDGMLDLWLAQQPTSACIEQIV